MVTVISRDVTVSQHRFCVSLAMHGVRIQGLMVAEVFTHNLMMTWLISTLTLGANEYLRDPA